MAIPEAQLQTWSNQGSTGVFTSTYETIRNVLWDASSPFASRIPQVFLQGSYKNTTNVYGDSDVDIVIWTDHLYYADTSSLSDAGKRAYDGEFVPGQFTLSDFKNEVVSWLNQKFPNDIRLGNKAIYIKGNGGRRDADVVVAAEFRRYYEEKPGEPKFYQGICFFLPNGTQIQNFPKQHSENCSSKNQSVPSFKQTVRIYKNLRNKMIADGNISSGLAPSYFIEGLLYNVPYDRFGGTYTQNFNNTLNWLAQSDRSQFVCANELFYLCYPGDPVCWRQENCTAFLNAAVNKRDNW